jgi:RNA polymerase sigma factor (sigma-70 family)
MNPAQSVHRRLARLYLASAKKLARRRHPAAQLHALEHAVAAAEHAQYADAVGLQESVALVRQLQTSLLSALGSPGAEYEMVAVPLAWNPPVEKVKWGTRVRLRGAAPLKISDEAAVVAAVEKVQAGRTTAVAEPGKKLSKADQDAKDEFARLYDAFYGSLYSKAAMACVKGGRKITTLGDRQDALDVMQGAFLKAMRNIGQFEFREPAEGAREVGRHFQFYQWLKRIVLNECMDWSRRMGKGMVKKEAQALLSKLKAREIPEELRGQIEYSVKAERVAQVIRESLARLPKKQRDLIVLSDMQGFSTGEQLAAATKKPRKTVTDDLIKARKSLQVLIHARLAPKAIETPQEIAALSEEEAEDVVVKVQRQLEAAQKEVAALKEGIGKKGTRGNPRPAPRRALARLMRL